MLEFQNVALCQKMHEIKVKCGCKVCVKCVLSVQGRFAHERVIARLP